MRLYLWYAGLGFLVLGKVIDGQFLSRVAARFWSICVFIIPLIIGNLSADNVVDEGGEHLMGGNVCDLTQKEIASVEATIEAAKTTIAREQMLHENYETTIARQQKSRENCETTIANPQLHVSLNNYLLRILQTSTKTGVNKMTAPSACI